MNKIQALENGIVNTEPGSKKQQPSSTEFGKFMQKQQLSSFDTSLPKKNTHLVLKANGDVLHQNSTLRYSHREYKPTQGDESPHDGQKNRTVKSGLNTLMGVPKGASDRHVLRKESNNFTNQSTNADSHNFVPKG